jgi:hypothetical protein
MNVFLVVVIEVVGDSVGDVVDDVAGRRRYRRVDSSV